MFSWTKVDDKTPEEKEDTQWSKHVTKAETILNNILTKAMTQIKTYTKEPSVVDPGECDKTSIDADKSNIIDEIKTFTGNNYSPIDTLTLIELNKITHLFTFTSAYRYKVFKEKNEHIESNIELYDDDQMSIFIDNQFTLYEKINSDNLDEFNKIKEQYDKVKVVMKKIHQQTALWTEGNDNDGDFVYTDPHTSIEYDYLKYETHIKVHITAILGNLLNIIKTIALFACMGILVAGMMGFFAAAIAGDMALSLVKDGGVGIITSMSSCCRGGCIILMNDTNKFYNNVMKALQKNYVVTGGNNKTRKRRNKNKTYNQTRRYVKRTRGRCVKRTRGRCVKRTRGRCVKRTPV